MMNIKELPAGWKEVRLKDLAVFRQDLLPESTSSDYRFRYVDIGSVEHERGIKSYQEMDFSEAPSRARKKVKTGDTIVSTVRTYLKAIAGIADDEDVVVSTGFAVLEPKLCIPAYLTYLVGSDLVCNEIDRLSWGVSYPAISESLMARIHVPLPPLDEQERIVCSLDAQMFRLRNEELILQGQLDVLEKYKRSFIHEAVTKGLDSTVPMKRSGIKWIGEIPNHWSVNRLKYLTGFESGATPSKDNLDFWDGQIPWVSSAEVKTDVITDTSLHISDEAVRSCSTTLMPEGSLVMVVRSGILQHTLPVAILGKPMTINQDIKGMRFGRDMLAKYFFYFVRGNNDNLLKALMKDKSTVDNVSQNYLSSLVLPVPPLCEQEAIIESLDARCARVDEVLNIKRGQVKALKRRRQSLVYEYVTGKRRVGKDS